MARDEDDPLSPSVSKLLPDAAGDSAAPESGRGAAGVVIEWTLIALGVLLAAVTIVAVVRGYASGHDVPLNEAAVALGVAAALLILRDVQKLSAFGFGIERRLERADRAAGVAEDAERGAKKAANLAVGSRVSAGLRALTGREGAKRRSARVSRIAAAPTERSERGPADDPEKRNYPAVSDRYELTGEIDPIDDDDTWASVTLSVRSTVAERPLRQPVRFRLHPTFPDSSPRVFPVDGVASLTIDAYEAFTAAAIVDGTRLELDLASLKGTPAAAGAPKSFWYDDDGGGTAKTATKRASRKRRRSEDEEGPGSGPIR
jgi:hypothetical protein